MSMSSPAPPAPYQDPSQVAETQSKYNLDAAIAQQAGSNVNQVTPYGSLTYSQSGTGPSGVPLYTATTKLDPTVQSIVDSLKTQTAAGLGRANYGSENPGDVIGNSTSGLTKDLLDKEVKYLDPFYSKQTEQLDTKLRNQGLDPSNPAYQQAMNNLLQSQNQGVTGFLATAEPAAYSQSVQNYTMPLTLASQEMGLMNPSFLNQSLAPTAATPTIQPANYTGAVANYQNMLEQQYQQQQQQSQNMMSGLFGVPTAILGGWARSGFAGLPLAAAAAV